MPQGAVGREPGRQVRAGDADDEAVGTREEGEAVTNRLIHGRKYARGVQRDIDDGGDDDDGGYACYDSADAFFRIRIHVGDN